MELNFQIFDNPKIQKKMDLDIQIENFTIEQCSDVIVNITNMVPDFKTVLRFDDLYNKPDKVDL
jgi:hypothetical protein